ncbi:MAG: beta-ketoacyl synthase N-terminal-like domain-containing protein, partial [Acidobacteriota bacterium]
MGDPENNLYEIAIVGMAGRFPGAEGLDEFWANLRQGVESISFFSPQELLEAGTDPNLLNRPGFVRARGVLGKAELFDAPLFGLGPPEARLIDPQQRVFLECAWHALENAGLDPDRSAGRVGVFAGARMSTYFLNNLQPQISLLGDGVSELELMLGNDRSFLATSTSYRLNLQGPSINVATACSTSLVAVHLACQSLLSSECDAALAGGVAIHFPQKSGYLHQKGGISSADGHCRSFDAAATGSVGGDGVGVVVLRRLQDALADGDPVWAVIKGSAINNDGSLKIGFTAPSIEGQSKVIREALQMAGVDPATVGSIEAHGSGTALGDPVEIRALERVFQPSNLAQGSCAVGSVKTNVGHLDAAAGVTGLIKAALSLHHGILLPSLHFEKPNPEIDFEKSPLYVNTSSRAWPDSKKPRRAGVSSFGIGGTNVHLVLEEAPRRKASGASRPWSLLLLSAGSPSSLDRATDGLARHLKAHPELSLDDVAYTTQAGRRVLNHRRMAVAASLQEAAEVLEKRPPDRLMDGIRDRKRPLVWMFPGLGDHYAGMAQELYAGEKVFREEAGRCFEILAGLPDGDALPDFEGMLFDGKGMRAKGPRSQTDFGKMLGRVAEEEAEWMQRPGLLHPAIFVVEYALAKLWESWGLRPSALIGFSLGEYTAACFSGVFRLEDALRVVVRRARLIEELPAGAMLAVPLPEREVSRLLGSKLALASVNAPRLCVVSGTREAVEALQKRLQRQGLSARQLPTTHALHSPLMEPAAGKLSSFLEGVEFQPPRIPYAANLTGRPVTATQACDPQFWSLQLCRTVRFWDGLTATCEGLSPVLLEVGPGQGLSSLIQQSQPLAADSSLLWTAVASLPSRYQQSADTATLLEGLGRLWLAGIQPDFEALHRDERRLKLRLPGYPFEHRRYFVDPPRTTPPQPPLEVRKPFEDISSRPQREQLASQDLGSEIHPRPALATPFAAPASADEERLAGLWSGLLCFEKVGRDDSFFELGGHSLLATQVISRIRQSFGVELTFQEFFQSPTVAGIASVIQTVRQSADRRLSLPLEPTPRDGDLPLSFAQQRLWFLDQLIPESALYNIPAALGLRGDFNPAVLEACFNEILSRHESLRTSFPSLDGKPRQQIHPPRWRPLPLLDLSALEGTRQQNEQSRLIQEEAARPFDLANGPVIRASMLLLEELLVVSCQLSVPVRDPKTQPALNSVTSTWRCSCVLPPASWIL